MTVSQILMHGAAFPDAALFVARASVGGFFAISGFHKLFNATRRASLRETFRADHVPAVPFMLVIPMGELCGGLGVLSGTLTVLAAAGLFALCLGACVLDGFKRIPAMNPLDRADALDDALYLPEVLYGVILLVVMAFGPGAYSVDSLVVRLMG